MEFKYTFEQIEEYLNDTLSSQEKRDFEQELENNPELAAEVDRHREIHTLVDLYTKVRIKDKVKHIYQSQSSTAAVPVFSIYRIAAAVVLVITAFSAYFYFYQTYSDASLVADNFEVYPNRFTTMGQEDADPFMQALSHYDKKEYVEALLKFQEVPQNSENYLAAQLYLGIAFFSLERFDEATVSFENVNETSSRYQEVGKWYLALCYLKVHRTDEAETLLKEVAGSGGYQSSKAQDILDRLQSPVRGLPGI